MNNSMIRIALLTVLSVISISGIAEKNTTATESALEHRISDLEKRVSELETIIKTTPMNSTRPSTSSNWKNLKNWRQLRTGMSYDEVRSLLGEPENINGGVVANWYWGGRKASVTFVSDALSSWSEPR